MALLDMEMEMEDKRGGGSDQYYTRRWGVKEKKNREMLVGGSWKTMFGFKTFECIHHNHKC